MISLAVLIAVAPVFHPSPTLLSLREAALLAQSSPQSQGTEPPKTKPPDDDFNLLAPEKKPDAAALASQARIQSEVNRRRTLLRLHQIGGYATLATMTATVVLGQLNYIDKYGGGGDIGTYRTPHTLVAYTAAGVFAATGILSVLAPNPFEKPLRLDTATLHKATMIVATAGMATQIVLGILTAGKEGTLAQRNFAVAHQIVGYTTLAATAAGFLVLTF
ncbi:MAG: hypothetical protein E6J62_00580 [Deltaproteobacteria bacterium]|nr:MAG: hypothetical protein E6J62_00580 [Deltaproteobacteria bacterium]